MKLPIKTERTPDSLRARFGTRWTAKRPLGEGIHSHAWVVAYGRTRRSAIRNLKKLEGGAK
jgi:hypothetical protein